MVSLPTLSTIALMIASGVIAAPWSPPIHSHTHRVRGLGPTGVQLKSYHPPSTFKGYGVDGVALPSTNVATATPEDMAKSFLQVQLDKLGVESGSLTWLSGNSFDGISYQYFNQAINGIPVANAVANVAMKGDKVMSYGASFVKPRNVGSSSPLISVETAIAKAASALGGQYNGWPTELKYVYTDMGDLILAHVVQIQNKHSGEWKQAYMSADKGNLVNVVDFVADHSYRVVPLQYQAPPQEYMLVSEPEDLLASPKTWHGTGNSETTDTSGNNVISYKGVPMKAIQPLGTSPQSSPNNNYDYPQDPSKEPDADPNVNAARVNAFYYRYGFNEAAFNFQNDNFGKGGKGNDRVQISVQDASGTNNANFATPPDGQPGQMRMYTWTYTIPRRDGAMENDIVTHEYTHGISNRATGGGSGSCLQTTEAGGMGEGWSDAMADITEAKTNPLADYTLGEYVYTKNIRTRPYSTDKNVNGYTYSTVATQNEVHNIGEVWANILHCILGALVEKYGLSNSAELHDPAQQHGNNILLKLTIAGFKLQPCNPTFLSARDAIIQADANHYGGANKCLLWGVFASRGLGTGAANYVNNMDVPSECK
ncbi:hypothetical protein FRC12_014057 [Ceratobasidium sp. 428]|nr:hypothetical protein FRC12_014057 [Ceratobasidium sp. 428]